MVKLLLAETLKRKKVSTRKFAKLLGVRYDYMMQFVRNSKKVTPNLELKTLERWAAILDVPVTSLLKDVPDKKPKPKKRSH